MESKFKPGDRVKIVIYGHLIWINKRETVKGVPVKPEGVISENETTWFIDIRPELVGKEDTVRGSYNYLYGNKGQESEMIDRQKCQYCLIDSGAWFAEFQLEKI